MYTIDTQCDYIHCTFTRYTQNATIRPAEWMTHIQLVNKFKYQPGCTTATQCLALTRGELGTRCTICPEGTTQVIALMYSARQRSAAL